MKFAATLFVAGLCTLSVVHAAHNERAKTPFEICLARFYARHGLPQSGRRRLCQTGEVTLNGKPYDFRIEQGSKGSIQVSGAETLQLRMWPKGKRYGGGPYGASVGYDKWGIEHLKQLKKDGKIQIKLKSGIQLCIKRGRFNGGEDILTNIDANLEKYLRKQGIWPCTKWLEDDVIEVTERSSGGYKPSTQSKKEKFRKQRMAANAAAGYGNELGATSPKPSPSDSLKSPLNGQSVGGGDGASNIRRRLALSERLGRAC